MAWFYLLLAGLMEVAWAFGLKQSDGFTRLVPAVLTLVAMGLSVALLAIAMRQLPLGTAYAIWTGIGAVGAFIVGIVVFGEGVTPARLFSAGLLLAGIVGLKLSSAG